MKDHRKDSRSGCVVPVDGKQGSLFTDVCTVDISRGGVGLLSGHRIPVNRVIPVALEFGENDLPVVVKGKVRWTRKIARTDRYRVGLRFEEITGGARALLRQYLKHNRG